VRFRLVPALLLLTACDGLVGGPAPGPDWSPSPSPATTRDAGAAGGSTDAGVVAGADAGPTPDVGPAPCEPTAAAVPKLLRLSNHEYRAMVSDLVGAPVDEALFARWTPVAEVYGFDTMSETRVDQQALEVQLDTAERIAKIVLATPSITAHCPAGLPPETPSCTLKPSYSARDDFSDTQARDCWTYLDSDGARMIFDNTRSLWRKDPDQTALLWRDGAHPGQAVDVIRRFESPVSGTVRLTGSFTDADPGGGDGVLVSIRQGGNVLFSRDLPNGGGATFAHDLALARGDVIDFVVERKANPNYDTTAFTAELTLAPTPRRSTWTWANCVEPLTRGLASRAYRRPVRDAELADYRALYTEALQGATDAGFEEPVAQALEALVTAVLLSPNFTFKPELVPGGVAPGERSYAIASRLGLFLRSSLPDERLWTLATQGALTTEAQIRAEATRLLAADARRFATSFGGQWLAFRDLGTSPLAASMREESIAVFEAALTESLTPDRLLEPGFTIVDAPLAAHYGLPAAGRQSTTARGGVLAQGTYLSKTGEGSEFRRPIHRGLWVLTRLLCRQLPRLDPATREEIGASFGAIDPDLPLPEKMKLHRDSTTRCGSCHSQIDPVGLALEKFDRAGRWRDTYEDGTPIVSDLQLNGALVRDPYELAAAIGDTAEFRACVSTKLLTYALNRGPQASEQCVAERLADPLDGGRPTLQQLTIDALVRAIELTEVAR
jgi:hypothetical protein